MGQSLESVLLFERIEFVCSLEEYIMSVESLKTFFENLSLKTKEWENDYNKIFNVNH